jgi:calcineurin-like phosphoesterase family protein
MLSKEFHYYINNQNELLKKYNGRVLVIIGTQVVGDFDSYDDAYFDSLKKYEPGTFALQRCSEGDKDYTHKFYSPIFR